jgi:hypothetical protein
MTSRVAALVALGALLGAAPASAATPYWGYAQYERTWAQLQADEEGEGSIGLLSVPLSGAIHVVATGYELDAWFTDSSIDQRERYTGGTLALGLHSTALTRAHAFGTLGYAGSERRVQTPSGQYVDHVDGGFLTVGAHWLIAPWLSFEPEGGIGYSGDYDIDAILHVRLGVRVLPRVWLIGGYHEDNGLPIEANSHYWSAGLRVAWRDSTTRPRGAKPMRGEAETAAPGLHAGQTLQAVRDLKLQQRAHPGAPESADVPAGARIVLNESVRNDFGTWWHITVGAEEGWIRETQLR